MKNKFFSTWYFHLLLFLLTLLTTTIAGAEFITGKFLSFSPSNNFSLDDFYRGFYYSIPFLLIFTAHEFGHYFTAVYHKVKTSLPYYIPLFLYIPFILPPMFGIGTLGAVIRIKQIIYSRKVFFDIGIAGPLAGFVVALFVLFWGFTQLPDKSYVLEIHPEYKKWGMDFENYAYDPKVMRAEDSLRFEAQQSRDSIAFYSNLEESGSDKWQRSEYKSVGSAALVTIGNSLLFEFFKSFVADEALLPHKYEIIHYPFLLVGFFALFFTALNLIPIGQLDGGHILYGLLGYKKSKIVSGVVFTFLVLYGGIGMVTLKEILQDPTGQLLISMPLYIVFLYFLFSRLTPDSKNNLLLAVAVFTTQFLITYFSPDFKGNPFWLFWAFILSRLLGIYHPPTLYDEPLDKKRKVLGWLSLVIFLICFSPEPLIIDVIEF